MEVELVNIEELQNQLVKVRNDYISTFKKYCSKTDDIFFFAMGDDLARQQASENWSFYSGKREMCEDVIYSFNKLLGFELLDFELRSTTPP